MLRSPAFWATTLLCMLLTAWCCAHPLTNMLSYESAFAFAVAYGALGPSLGLSIASSQGRSPVGTGRGWTLACPLALAAAPMAALFVFGRIHGHCNDGIGALFWLLVAWPSLMYGACAGVVAGQFRAASATRLRRMLAAVAIVVSAAAAPLWHLHQTPTARAFSHLLGYFAGSLYDEDIAITRALVCFRAATALRIVALVALGRWLGRRPGGVSPRWQQAAACMAVWAAAIGVDVVAGPNAGYAVDAAAMQRALPMVVARQGIVVHLPAGTPPALAQRIGDDHQAALAYVRVHVPQRDAPPIHSYVFATAQQKANCIGMAQTQLCKPWQRALFLHGLQAPHPLLPHEVVHAALAPWGRAPLSLPAFAGVLPHLGLVEGMAVALAPDDTPLGLWDTAKSLRAEGLGAPLQLLFDPRPWRSVQAFWGEAPQRVYLQAGAFCSWLLQQQGDAVMLDAYRDGDLLRATGVPVATLVANFDRALQAGEPPPRTARQQVAGRYRQASLFVRRCPHEAARLWRQAGSAQGEAKVALVQAWAELADGASDRLLVVVATIESELQAGRLNAAWQAKATALLQGLLGRQGDVPAVRVQVLAAGIAAAASREQWPLASELLAQAQGLPSEASWQRHIEVMRWALGRSPALRQSTFALLRRPGDQNAAAQLEQAYRSDPGPAMGVAAYLLGRSKRSSGQAALANEWLRRAGPLDFAALEHERLRTLIEGDWAAGATGDALGDIAAFRALRLSPSEVRFADAMQARLAVAASRQ